VTGRPGPGAIDSYTFPILFQQIRPMVGGEREPLRNPPADLAGDVGDASMGCPTYVTPWNAFQGTIGPSGSTAVTVIGGSSPIPSGASIAFCRLAVQCGTIGPDTAVVVMDADYTQYYSTEWCQVANRYNETIGFCPIQGNDVHLHNFDPSNTITVFLAVIGYA
jgi:hypothetical protein